VKEPVDVAVIGAGPAGCAASIQAVRLGLSVVLLDETGEPGGLVRNAWSVRNYPGIEPVPGTVLAGRLGEHLERSDIGIIRERINLVRRAGDLLHSEGDDLLVSSRALVIATGTVPRSPGIDGEETAGSVYFNPLEVPRPFPGEVAIVGGGEAAFDYALTAAGAGAETLILVRGAESAVTGSLLRNVLENPRIRILYDTSVGRVRRSGEGLILHTFSNDEIREVPVGALLVAVGRRGTHPVTEEGLLLDCGDELHGTGGVFTAGDLRAGRLGQACIAAGQGIMAATRAFDFVRRGEMAT
jgi:thioredoxin reductase (NADPH)